MPQNFKLDEVEADIYTPLGQDTLPILRNRRAHFVTPLARLRPGATLRQAQTELSIIGRQLAAAISRHQQRVAASKSRRSARKLANRASILWLLLGAVSLVLLIACANIASLLLARAVSRDANSRLRSALGAGRGRLARQCLTESSVLGLLGGVLGISLAAIGVGPFVKFWPGALPRAEEVHLDWHVLLVRLWISLSCGILFGLAPALRIPTRNLEHTLRAGARSVAGSSRRLHGSFVISQIALAVVLLVSAGMLGRTLLRVSALSPGVDIHNMLVMRTALSPATLPDPPRIRAAWQDLLDHSRAVPGVDCCHDGRHSPSSPGKQSGQLFHFGRSSARRKAASHSRKFSYFGIFAALWECVCFAAASLKIPTVSARNPSSSSTKLWRNRLSANAIRSANICGLIWAMIPSPSSASSAMSAIGDSLATIKIPSARSSTIHSRSSQTDYLRRWSELMSIAIRTNVPPLSVVESLRQSIRGSAGDQVMYSVSTMEQLASDSLAQQRFLMLLIGFSPDSRCSSHASASTECLLTSPASAFPEIGVRMALGATARDVVRLVLRQSLAMILIGVVGRNFRRARRRATPRTLRRRGPQHRAVHLRIDGRVAHRRRACRQLHPSPPRQPSGSQSKRCARTEPHRNSHAAKDSGFSVYSAPLR